ncbi:hypothetical protein G5V59_20515 [Nocardioides sp. W3-2-3]|uniref:hypothetical protein n=1 Tax=Nocardioides convexus TaxID=2712224 RepID=UPI00241894B0|nr:hypothetical protein [Nocardioides convexus]NHA01414.1 hypothetical protein [Nocardioides convexus]
MGRRSRFFGSTMWQAYFVEAMVLLESLRDPLHPRRGVQPRQGPRRRGRRARRRLPLPRLAGLLPPLPDRPRLDRDAGEHHLLHRDGQDHLRDDLAHRHLDEPHHGGRLAPLHRLVQHLVQA